MEISFEYWNMEYKIQLNLFLQELRVLTLSPTTTTTLVSGREQLITNNYSCINS